MTAGAAEPATLLGRGREVERLVGALVAAVDGRGRLVILAGEAGIGKTRLADALADAARGRNARVLWGRCWEAGGAPPFWPWIQAIRALVRDVEPEALRRAIGPRPGEILRIIPDLRDVLPDLPAGPEASSEGDDGERLRSFVAMAGFLDRMAAVRPILLVLDDLHASDEPSLLLLRFLASELSESRVLVLAIYRDDELDPADPAAVLLAELARIRSAERLSLRGLDVDEIDRYLEAAAGRPAASGVAEAIRRETDGNPLFLSEVVRLLLDEGRLDHVPDPGGRGLGVTEGVQAVMRRRLARLSAPCLGLLEHASVLGGDLSLDLLEAIEERPADELVPLLDEAVSARVLAVSPGPAGRWRFAHGLFREVVYGGLPTRSRLALHRRVAEVLESRGADSADAPLAEIAHHYVAAGAGPKAVEAAARAAARALAVYAYEEAVRLYRLALEAGETDDERRCELRIALGGALAKAGDATQARAEFLEAAKLAERLGTVEQLARAVLGYGGQFIWLRAGSDAALVPLLERALERLGPSNDALRARLLARLSGALRDEPTITRRDAISAEALALARRLGDPVILGHAIVARTWAIRAPDRTAEIDLLIAEMEGVVAAGDDPELVLDFHWIRFNQMRVVGADRAALHQELNALWQTSVELRQPHRLHLTVERTILALLEGRLADVESYLPGLALAPDPFSLVAGQFLLRREQDRLDDVASMLRDAVASVPGYPLLVALHAFLDARLGRRVAAGETLDRLAGNGYAEIPFDWGWVFAMTFLGETAVILGRVDRGREIEALLRPYAGTIGSASGEGSSGPVSRMLGLLAALDGRLDEGLDRLQDAARESARMGATLWETRIAVERAAMLVERRRPGDVELAKELLDGAKRTSRELGLIAIDHDADAVETALLGATTIRDPDASPPPGPDTAPAVAEFRREGETWAIRFGRTFRLRDSKGLRYLKVLLAEPGREFHALDLVRLLDGAATEPVGHGAAASEGLGSAGDGAGLDILDAEARAAYRARLRELSMELEEAESFNDPIRADRARGEIDALEAELAGAFGLGGRSRQAASPAERARQSVTKAIRDAMGRIRSEDPALHAHLSRSVATGLYCRYDPDPAAAPDWSF